MSCCGTLIDADHIVEWWDSKLVCTEHAHRSVSALQVADSHSLRYRQRTLPYLSLRLLEIWAKDNESALDDLESFIWVILHVIILNRPCALHDKWLLMLANHNRTQHLANRDHIKARIYARFKALRGPQLEPALAPFLSVLVELFNLHQEMAFFPSSGAKARKLGIARSRLSASCSGS